MNNHTIKKSDISIIQQRTSLMGKLSLFLSLPFLLLAPLWVHVGILDPRGVNYYWLQQLLTVLLAFSLLLNVIGLVLGIIHLFKKGNKILSAIGILLNLFSISLAFYAIMHAGG